jgi:hypothetical protein
MPFKNESPHADELRECRRLLHEALAVLSECDLPKAVQLVPRLNDFIHTPFTMEKVIPPLTPTSEDSLQQDAVNLVASRIEPKQTVRLSGGRVQVS